MATDDKIEELETLLDTLGMVRLLKALATISAEKADHLRSNWQDELSAKCWDRTSAQLEKQADSPNIQAVC